MSTSLRVIIHLDLDHFFSQCEELRKPELRDKPVVVCVFSGRTEVSGVVSTSNYLARRLGVKSGLPIVAAKKILKERKDAAFLPMDREYYEKVSSSVMKILRRFTDSFEQAGIDETFLDVTDRCHGDFGEARRLALKAKGEILTGEGIICSIGIAPNKLVAKIASDFQKPNGLTIVKPEEVTTFLDPLPIGKLIGVGKKSEKVMGDLGIKTIGDLAKHDPDSLINIFGKNLGRYFHRAAMGIDEEPVVEREGREQISRIVTLKANTRDVDALLPDLHRISQDLHEKLAEQGLSFKSIGIIVIDEGLTMHTRSTTLEEPVRDLEIIERTAEELFRAFFQGEDAKARRIGVKVFNLSKKTDQSTLMDFIEGA